MQNKIKTLLAALPLPANFNRNQFFIWTIGTLLTGAIIFSLWNQSQGYVPLFGARERLPVSQVVDVLAAENIAYRISPDTGQILVTSRNLPRARLALAAKGITAIMPEGYALMDKEEMLGTSQFIQNVRYKRSLEGELARSIMAINAIEEARVHLGLSESSSFVISNKPESSASVIVDLYHNQTLDEQQVDAIVQLVAGSVPGLKATNVRVVDQAGRLLSDNEKNQRASMSKSASALTQQIKEDAINNITRILVSFAGAENFRISVAPDVELNQVEETNEQFGKDPHVSSEQLIDEQNVNQLAMGIPGSLSNQPTKQNTPPSAADKTPANSATATPPPANTNPEMLTKRKQQQRNYTFDKTVRHTRFPGYLVKRVQVAVVLNKMAPALQKITPEQITAIKKLVEEAAGLNKARGDSLTLDLLTFTTQSGELPTKPKWWQDQDIQYWARLTGYGLLGLLTLLFGVRPLAKRFARENRAKEGTDVAGHDERASGDDKLAATLAGSSFNQENSLPPLSSGLETKVEYLQTLAKNETERVAEVMKQWINSNERSKKS